MKIRNCFVSNSSSSSFVIAYKNSTDKCEHCGRTGGIDLPKILSVEGGDFDETYVIINGISGVSDRLLENYQNEIGYLSKDDIEERKEEFIKYASDVSKISEWSKKGYNIIWLNISYSDEKMIRSLVAACDSEIILEKG